MIPARKIAQTADQIDQAVGDRIVKHPVDSEVASDSVFLDSAKAHRRGPASVGVFGVGAERRDLDRLVVIQHNADHAELRADRHRAVEHFLHDLRTRVSRDVVVLGLDAKDSIAHTSAGENGAKAGIDKTANDVQRLFFFVAHWRLSNRAFYSAAIGRCHMVDRVALPFSQGRSSEQNSTVDGDDLASHVDSLVGAEP